MYANLIPFGFFKTPIKFFAPIKSIFAPYDYTFFFWLKKDESGSKFTAKFFRFQKQDLFRYEMQNGFAAAK